MNPPSPEPKVPSSPTAGTASLSGSGSAPHEDPATNVGAEAQAVAETVKAQGQEALADIKDAGADVAAAVQDKAEDLAERGKQAGAEQGEGLAGAARRVADDLQETSPEIARHVRSAADAISGVSASLRDRSVGDLLNEVNGFARRQPAAFFGAAVLAGFAVTRFAKSSSSHDTSAGSLGTPPPTSDAPKGQAPGWVPSEPGDAGSGTPAIRPATMPAATLGGSAAHQPGAAEPGSMPTIQGSTS